MLIAAVIDKNVYLYLHVKLPYYKFWWRDIFCNKLLSNNTKQLLSITVILFLYNHYELLFLTWWKLILMHLYPTQVPKCQLRPQYFGWERACADQIILNVQIIYGNLYCILLLKVSVTAMEDSRVLLWHRDKLKLSIITDQFLQAVFDHILGRDVVKKLMQVSRDTLLDLIC